MGPPPPFFIALCQVASTLDSSYSLKMPSAKVAAKKKADDKAKAKLGVKKTVKTKKVKTIAKKEKTKKPSGAKPKSAPKKKVTKGGKESLRSSLHCLVQLSPSYPSEYK